MSEHKYEWGEDAELDRMRTNQNVSKVCKDMEIKPKINIDRKSSKQSAKKFVRKYL